MTKLDEYKEMLVEFHKAFQLPVARSFAEADSKNCPLRVNLLAEEYQEYSAAKERPAIIDGIGDLMYVFIGTVITVGVSPMEGAYQLPPLIPNTGVVPKLLFPGQMAALIRALEERVLCHRKLLDTQTTVYYKILQAAWSLGIDLMTAVRRIHKSNMTKLWTQEEIRSIVNTPDLFTVTPTLNARFIVKRKSDGKVIKSPSYTPVVLDDL